MFGRRAILSHFHLFSKALEFADLLSLTRAFIAGEAALAWALKDAGGDYKPDDLDLFVPVDDESEDSRNFRIIEELYRWFFASCYYERMPENGSDIVCHNGAADLGRHLFGIRNFKHRISCRRIQLILLKGSQPPEKFVKTFDLDICRFYVVEDNGLKVHYGGNDGSKDHRRILSSFLSGAKRMRVTDVSTTSASNLEARLTKYYGRGFVLEIQVAPHATTCADCTNTVLSEWKALSLEEAKEFARPLCVSTCSFAPRPYGITEEPVASSTFDLTELEELKEEMHTTPKTFPKKKCVATELPKSFKLVSMSDPAASVLKAPQNIVVTSAVPASCDVVKRLVPMKCGVVEWPKDVKSIPMSDTAMAYLDELEESDEELLAKLAKSAPRQNVVTTTASAASSADQVTSSDDEDEPIRVVNSATGLDVLVPNPWFWVERDPERYAETHKLIRMAKNTPSSEFDKPKLRELYEDVKTCWEIPFVDGRYKYFVALTKFLLYVNELGPKLDDIIPPFYTIVARKCKKDWMGQAERGAPEECRVFLKPLCERIREQNRSNPERLKRTFYCFETLYYLLADPYSSDEDE